MPSRSFFKARRRCLIPSRFRHGLKPSRRCFIASKFRRGLVREHVGGTATEAHHSHVGVTSVSYALRSLPRHIVAVIGAMAEDPQHVLQSLHSVSPLCTLREFAALDIHEALSLVVIKMSIDFVLARERPPSCTCRWSTI